MENPHVDIVAAIRSVARRIAEGETVTVRRQWLDEVTEELQRISVDFTVSPITKQPKHCTVCRK